jgi:tetratricopeptide (TPR) repeat protein
LHAHIVEALETAASDCLADQVEQLAHHAQRGELWDKSLLYYRQAGDKAMTRSAPREALACFEQALVAIPHLPEQYDTLVQAIDLRIGLDHALLGSGEPRRGFEHLREAERLAERLGYQQRLGRICSAMVHYCWRTGDYDHAIAYGQRALALTEAIGDVFEQAKVQGTLGTVYFYLGDYRGAMHLLRQSIETLEGERLHQRPDLGMVVTSVRSRIWLVNCLGELGEFAEGLACGEEAARIAEAAGHLGSAIFTQGRLGQLVLRQGNLPWAITVLERALADCYSVDISLFLLVIAANLGLAYAMSGRVDEALSSLEQALGQQSSSGQRGGSREMITLGEAYLLANRLVDADQLAKQALGLSRDRKERGAQAWALRLLGELSAYPGRIDIKQAEIHYRQALVLATELGMRPLQAHCHRGLGKLYSQTSQSEQARTELTTAIDMYRDMEMNFWLPETEAALASVEGR